MDELQMLELASFFLGFGFCHNSWHYVGNQVRTYRGRSRVAGFRGIAVGFPERLSYAFNAETGAFSAIWQGDFIGVNWNGQGSGDFNPASEPITLPQDVSFVQLEDENAPWPLIPVMTKEARLNPDPLYPKNVGYQFRGYFLGESSIPTFMYCSGTIEIEDRSMAAGYEGHPQLLRVLQFDSPVQQTVWFRALTGDVAEDSLSAEVTLEKLDQGFVYEFDLVKLRSQDKEALLHRNAFYTVNEVPSQ